MEGRASASLGAEAGKTTPGALEALHDGERLAALRETGALDTGPEEGLDRLTRLAANLLSVPVSLICLVDEQRQFFKSQIGLQEPWASAGETPLSHSICQHLVYSNALAVEDAREHALVRDSLAIPDLDVAAYLGVPLRTRSGHTLGAFCAIDSKVRAWTEDDLQTLRELAAAAMAHIELGNRLARILRDSVTGLPTREAFIAEIDRALGRSEAEGAGVAVLVVDPRRLRAINDSFGGSGGDRLLAAVATRLQNGLPGMSVARTSGNQFSVLSPAAGGKYGALKSAETIRGVMAPKFLLDGTELHVGLTIGIAISDGSDTAEELLEGAARAVDRAKNSPGHVEEVADEAFSERARQGLHLETALRSALERRGLTVFYQPRVKLAEADIVGFEALCRWHDPELGAVEPARFIPIAEESGLIAALDREVLGKACRQAAAWQDAHPESDLSISVNLSPLQIAATDVAAVVSAALDDAGLPAHKLELEITERLLLEPRHADRLKELVALGCGLCVDDFGTGYSSLSYLCQFPLQGIKIDRSFVAGMRDGGGQAVVRAIIAMAEGLGLQVTAEGVETEADRDRLRKLGCTYAQGFLFGRPASAELTGKLLGD